MNWAARFWLIFHVVGLGASALDPAAVFGWYALAFALAEAVLWSLGHPMTRYVRAALRWAENPRTDPLVGFGVAVAVMGWASLFAIGFANHGWFGPGLNSFLAILLFMVWIIPHFFGDRWG